LYSGLDLGNRIETDIINSVERLPEEHSKTRPGMGACHRSTICYFQPRNSHHLGNCVLILKLCTRFTQSQDSVAPTWYLCCMHNWTEGVVQVSIVY